MTSQYFIKLSSNWMDGIYRLLATTSLAEMLCAFSLPLLALLIGIRINRYVKNKPTHTLSAKTIDFMGPLIAPLLAILFTAIASAIFVHLEMKPALLPFASKLSVAWLAVQVVMTLSSGRTAGLFIMLVILPVTLLHLFDVWDITVALLNEVNFMVGSVNFNLYLILKAAITLVIMLWLVNFVLTTTEGRLRRVRTMRASNRTLILKFMQIGMYVLVFLFALNMIGVSFTALSIFSGALGVGIGFGLQKIASNFISGIILLFEKSIEVGDIIQLESGLNGTVAQTSGRYTMVSTADGKDVMIPNEEFITQRVTSLTYSNKKARVEIAVGVGYDDDIELALKLLVQAAAEEPRCLKDPVPGAYITAFADSSINLWLLFWVEDIREGKLGAQTKVMLNILKLFREHGISIPYPHQVQLSDAPIEDRLKAVEAALALTTQATATDTLKKTTTPKAKA